MTKNLYFSKNDFQILHEFLFHKHKKISFCEKNYLERSYTTAFDQIDLCDFVPINCCGVTKFGSKCYLSNQGGMHGDWLVISIEKDLKKENVLYSSDCRISAESFLANKYCEQIIEKLRANLFSCEFDCTNYSNKLYNNDIDNDLFVFDISLDDGKLIVNKRKKELADKKDSCYSYANDYNINKIIKEITNKNKCTIELCLIYYILISYFGNNIYKKMIISQDDKKSVKITEYLSDYKMSNNNVIVSLLNCDKFVDFFLNSRIYIKEYNGYMLECF